MQPNTASPASSIVPPVAASTRMALAALSLSMLMSSLDTSIANVSLPTLAQAFDASFQAVQWVVLAYLLAITSLIVSAGRLGDMVGRRRLLLGGIGLFTLASVGCGLAPNLPLLIAARALQGVGGAVMMALTMALVGATVPKERTGSAMGLLGTMSAAGTSLGPSLSGIVIGALGWRAIFLIQIPLGLLAGWLAYRYLAADARRTTPRPRFDHAGTLVLALMLAAYALAMTLGRGQFGALNLLLLLVALVGVAVFVWVQRRARAPLVQLALLRQPQFVGSLIMSALVACVIMTTFVVGPFYLSHGLGLATTVVGLTMSVGPLSAALSGVPTGRLVDRFGAKRMTVVGLSGMSLGAGLLAVMPSRFGVAGYLVPLVGMTIHYALFQGANNTAVMRQVDTAQRGVVAGMLSLARNLGLVTGVCVMGAVFSAASGSVSLETASAQAISGGMRVTFAVAAALLLAGVLTAWRVGRKAGNHEA
ncbi:MFS transporter [Pandoraea pneumonica]|uniref:MFS transporter n=1 Tax=Pandoraea pneumonica TaxID=2508299 RepID=UPI003CF352A1